MKLPIVTSIRPLPSRSALLTLATGRSRTVLKSDRVIFAPDLNLMSVGGKAYHIPAHLHEAARRALSVGRVSL